VSETTINIPSFVAWKLAVAIGIGLRLGWDMPEIVGAILGAIARAAT
jgi:hypothetical protein